MRYLSLKSKIIKIPNSEENFKRKSLIIIEVTKPRAQTYLVTNV